MKSKVKVKVAHSCQTLCHPTDYTDHGILQARLLEWVAISFSRGSSQPRIKPVSLMSPALAGSSGKESACNVGNLGSIPGLGTSPGEGKGYTLQCSGGCLWGG